MSVKAHAKVEDKDHGWLALLKRIKQARNGRVKVGVLAEEGGDEKEEGSNLSVAEIAHIQHFGTATIPARPFLSMAFDQHREELAKMGAALMKSVIGGEMDADRALGIMGAKLAAEAKKVITVGNQLAPLAQSTILSRMREKRDEILEKQSAAQAARQERRKAREAAANARLDARLRALSGKTKRLGDVFRNIDRARRMQVMAEEASEQRAVRDRAADFGAIFKEIGRMAAGARPLVDTGRLLGAITWAIDKEGH